MKLPSVFKFFAFFLLAIMFNHAFAQAPADPISEYYESLKKSKQNGGPETAFMSVGSDMLYGLEYFEAGQFDYASWRFRDVLKKEPENAYANFLYGASIAKLGQAEEARTFLQKAAVIMPGLNDLAQSRIAKLEVKPKKSLFDDAPAGKPEIVVKPAAPKPKPAQEQAGGKLVYGSYACDYMQYQGSTVGSFTPAYKAVYKGYFVLKSDGTYRWLDNGGTGKYSYNSKTGAITWLSGHLKALQPLKTTFTDGQKVASVSIQMTENYRWGCGCNK